MKPTQNLIHVNNVEYKEDSIVKVFKYNRVVLKYKTPENFDLFEPKFFDRLILINNKILINVDSICSKNELYNSSFNFYTNCIKVTKECKNKFKIKVYLGQVGCVGDFCQDLIEFNIIIMNGKLEYLYKEK